MTTTSRSQKKSIRYLVLPALASAGLLQACASPVSRQNTASFLSQMNAGDYKGAADTASKSGNIGADGKSANIAWSLNAGAATFDDDESTRSIAIFDNTEKLMQADDLNRAQAALDYKFMTYDGVMADTYTALDFLKQGDADNARIEFNRAEDRQRRAEDHFQLEAEASRQQMANGNGADLQALVAKAEGSDAYSNEVSANSQIAASYAPFENPFATYLGGIFLLTEQNGTAADREVGLDKLKRAYGVLGPDASSVQSDIAWAKGMAKGHKASPQTWVIFENGQSATFQEMRLVLPMITGKPMTLAMPALARNALASDHVNVLAGGATAATSSVGSFDAVMASEFDKRMPMILTGAVAEVVLKNGLSVAAQKSNNAVFGLIAGVAANVSSADTRSWTALPKEFQAVRVATPPDGRISLTTAEGASVGDVQVPTDRPSIVYVKLQHVGANPSLQVIKL